MMSSARLVGTMLLQIVLCLALTFSVKSQGLGLCQNFHFVLNEHVFDGHALVGHVVQTHTVKTAAQCHVMCKDNCQCVSFNHLPSEQENNCELNDANKEMKPDALKVKSRAQYYDLVRSYTKEGGQNYSPGKDRCVNRCCQPSPCLHGGRCQEICDPKDTRFNCTCPTYYVGKRCELRCYASCKEAFQANLTKSGSYIICNGQQKPFYVYCDMESDSKFVWTLIQTFSFSQKHLFENKSFVQNHPINMDSERVHWTAYRLSLSQMQYLIQQSTLLRVTCNFAQEGLIYTDYALAPLNRHNLLSTFNKKCKWYYHLNIRGIQCFEYTALTNQREGRAWFINSYASKMRGGCQFDGRPGMLKDEQNFGWYQEGKVNPQHRCSSSPSSSTEHWLGI